MRIAVASIIEETCSFNPVKVTLEDFKGIYFKLGRDVVEVPPHELVVGGFVAAMKPRRHALEGILSAHAGAAGPLSARALADLISLVVAGLGKSGPFDAVFLSLMGAMAAEGEPDATGAIVEAVRKIVGRDCFIAAAIDHHGLITQRIFETVDVVVGYETQPHDFPGSGAKTARVMQDIWDRKRTPHGAMARIPMITPQDHYLTAIGPMKEWFDLAREIEHDPAVIVASTFPTQPWLDVPEYGWVALVYADDAEKARGHADRLAQKAWDLRERFWRSSRLSVADTVTAANAEPRGLVVISDTGDSAWGGSPGDSTAIIGEMLKQGLNGPALVPVVDPAAREQAAAAGVGRRVTLRLGRKSGAQFSPGREISGTVKAVDGGGWRDFGDGRTAMAGRSALLDCGQLQIAILEKVDVAINHPVLYQKLGLDVARAKMVVLKTASNFQYFKPYQSRLIRADSPGPTQSDLTTLPWTNLPRPIYPFEEIKDWKP